MPVQAFAIHFYSMLALLLAVLALAVTALLTALGWTRLHAYSLLPRTALACGAGLFGSQILCCALLGALYIAEPKVSEYVPFSSMLAPAAGASALFVGRVATIAAARGARTVLKRRLRPGGA